MKQLHLVKPFSVVLLFICLAIALVSTLSSPVFLLSLFNGMVLAVVVGTSKHEEEVDDVWSSFQDYPCYDDVRNEGEDVRGNCVYEGNHDGTCHKAKNKVDEGEGDDGSSDDHDKGCEQEEELDGYDEDDDEDGSGGEVEWEDDHEKDEDEEQEDEVVDDHLEERAQEFITKVTREWRDELIREQQQWYA